MGNRISLFLSITALLIAVGGATPVGEAAWNQLLPRNSVGTVQLKRNAVKSSKIAPNAVRTGHVLDGTLLTADFKAGQIPPGPKGDKGDKGDRGPAGPGATVFATTVPVGTGDSTLATIPNGITVAASCNAVTGAVLRVRTTSGEVTLQASGTLYSGATVAALYVNATTDSTAIAGTSYVGFGVIARDLSVAPMSMAPRF